MICERLVPPPALAELPALEPGSHLGPLIEWSNAQGVDELAWVGHAPDVNWLAAALVGARETGFDFAKGAVAAIAFDGQISEGAGTLLWLATPKSLGARSCRSSHTDYPNRRAPMRACPACPAARNHGCLLRSRPWHPWQVAGN